MGSDPFARFAESYLAGKLAEIEDALAEIDALPDALAHSATRRRLVEIQAQLLGALASFRGAGDDAPAPRTSLAE